MAVEFVGSALLSASLQVAFDRLASAEVVEYFQGRRFNDKLLKKLNIMLLSINAVVDDAEQKQIRNQHVKAWLDAVKEVVFEGEDLLDEIEIQVSQCKREAKSESATTKVWNFFNTSTNSFDKEIESKIQEVLDSLEYLASKKDILGLKETSIGYDVASNSQVSQKLTTTSLLGETVLYGRDVDREIIFDLLISHIENKNQFSVVSIVGMGGMGKTLLAQHLYNDSKMVDEFEIKAWVCISEEFDVFKITRAILEGVTGSTDDSRELNMVQERLKEKLTGKRFLLVLDDVWNENRDQWEALQTPFKYGALGSKILITTRSMEVAYSSMRSAKIHQLEKLQEEHCWKLFSKHAFIDENPQLNHEMLKIAKEIIGKCKGLPLALKTIGSLLHTKSSLMEWKTILASEIWDLPEEVSNILPALRLSYHHLPSHLKRCFSYCSLFPKDYVFEKEYLILLWMAEDFLPCPQLQQSKSMEEVGEQYFEDLLSRSFFQQSSKDEMCFVMHDLLNDLAKYVSGDFCFRLEVEESQNISKVTRHFSFLRNSYESSKRFEALCKAENLRTFLPFSRNCTVPPSPLGLWMSGPLVHELLPRFKVLRVLSLSGYCNVIDVPDTIGNLKHLRYLDLSKTNIKKLPDSICFLFNLQILKMKNCRFLEELPLNFHQLANLRFLDFSGTKVRSMPMHFGKLKNLHVLNSFYVGKGSEFESNIQQLGELDLRGALSISELQNIVNPFDALATNLKNKVHLVKLHLEWNADTENSQQEREVLEKLQPSQHLKELSIRSYGGTRFPYWFGDNSLSTLVSLKLSNCEKCILLPPLGILPSLKKLCIIGLSGVVVIGTEFYGSSVSTVPFPSLETLQFEDMEEWEKWECKSVTNAFPCLQKLSIKNCPNLRECLPEKLLCLMILEISHCYQLVASVPRTPFIHELYLSDCGELKFDYHPSTLKILKIDGYCMEGSLKSVESIISNIFLERMKINYCPEMNIPKQCCYNFLVALYIWDSCDSLTTFSLDLFPKLKELQFRDCANLERISQEKAHNLQLLQISRCPKFVSFPRGGFNAPSHGHKNTVLCVKWNQNGNWVLTASKDQIIKLYDIRAMKELESFRGHLKDVSTLAWHPFHEEYFVSGSYDGSIFHCLVGHDTPQIEISNAHDNNVWDLVWHPVGYLLYSGSGDHTAKFWCRNRPGDSACDRYNNGMQGYPEQNPVAGRVGGNFAIPEGPTTPGPFSPGLTRNEGTIPGVGVAMLPSIPSLDGPQGEQKQPHPGSMGAPPLPPGPHPSLLNPNQQQPFQQNPQQIPQHQHQALSQQMGPLPMPPNIPQLQHPSHSSMVPHQHMPRPPPQMPHGMPGSLPPTSHPMSIPGPMGMQGGMNQMGPPMPQGHYVGMNQMHSGPLPSSGGPPLGGFPNNMQGPSNTSYPQGAPFNRPQGGQMPMMQGYNPYQSGNQSGMSPNKQPGGPHSQMPQ